MPSAGASAPGERDALLGGHDEPALWVAFFSELYIVQWGLANGAAGGVRRVVEA